MGNLIILIVFTCTVILLVYGRDIYNGVMAHLRWKAEHKLEHIGPEDVEDNGAIGGGGKVRTPLSFEECLLLIVIILLVVQIVILAGMIV